MYSLILCILHSEQAKSQNRFHIDAIPFPLSVENKPKAIITGKNNLLLVADSLTDMFRDPNVTYNTDNAPKLLFTPDEHFVLSCSIQHDFRAKWDGGAMVLKTDSLNWVKFCFEKDYKLKKRVVSVVTRNVSDDCNSVEIASDKVYYKMAKADNVVTLYYSLDGADWMLVRHLQIETRMPFRIGFLAQSPTGTECSVEFKEIRYEAKKIKDPYAGN
jgi:regulation of enolase protein 1 (concanavalin A-like superfamily)